MVKLYVTFRNIEARIIDAMAWGLICFGRFCPDLATTFTVILGILIAV